MAKQRSKQGWAGISEATAAKRLGELLGVAFDAEPIADLGGSEGALAEVGDEAWAALQFERKHGHPVENVLQYWRWLERTRRRLVLVHAIAPEAPRRSGPRADLTQWLGQLMERVLPGRFAYCRIELGSKDEARQIDAAREAVSALREPRESRSLIGEDTLRRG